MDLNVSIHDVFEKAYKRYPDKEFIYDGYKRLTYKDIKQMSDSIASAFHQLGIGKGDRIIACLPNWHEFLAIYFAIAKIGAILVPCNTRYRVEELSYIVANSGAKAIFVVEEHGHFHTVKSLMESNESALEMVFTVRFQEDGHHSFEDLLKNRTVEAAAGSVHRSERRCVFHFIYFRNNRTSERCHAHAFKFCP
ncbi:class I adenylate-forming enzyme family protein [Aeribacillus sp. FSL M8-0254]|uniref:class I adenylate-forming enzyme family protein n=1 Tax=Aeribacillus sp. FSL M8-0254 TaxID=2954577 RepID=UPI0030F56B25